MLQVYKADCKPTVLSWVFWQFPITNQVSALFESTVIATNTSFKKL